MLPELTADDLISIGVTSVGHRRELLAAIAALRTDARRRLLHGPQLLLESPPMPSGDS